MKTFEWGLLKICCAFLCMLTLLTACSNEELVENTSNCVGEEYVEIEGEKTSNGSQEHVTVDELKELPAIIAEAKQICNLVKCCGEPVVFRLPFKANQPLRLGQPLRLLLNSQKAKRQILPGHITLDADSVRALARHE